MAICFGGNWKYEMAGFGNIHWRVTIELALNDHSNADNLRKSLEKIPKERGHISFTWQFVFPILKKLGVPKIVQDAISERLELFYLYSMSISTKSSLQDSMTIELDRSESFTPIINASNPILFYNFCKILGIENEITKLDDKQIIYLKSHMDFKLFLEKYRLAVDIIANIEANIRERKKNKILVIRKTQNPIKRALEALVKCMNYNLILSNNSCDLILNRIESFSKLGDIEIDLIIRQTYKLLKKQKNLGGNIFMDSSQYLEELASAIKEREEILESVLNTPSSHDPKTVSDSTLFVMRRYNSWYPSFFKVDGGCYYILLAANEEGKSRGILIDPGFRFLKPLRENGIEVSDIDTVLVSHFHPDHMAGIFEYISLRYTIEKKTYMMLNPTTYDSFKSLGTYVLEVSPIRQNTIIELAKPYKRLDGKYEKVALRAFQTNHVEMKQENQSLGFEIIFETCDNESFNRRVRKVQVGLLGDTSYESGNIELVNQLDNSDIIVLHLGSMQEKRRYGKHLYLNGLERILRHIDTRIDQGKLSDKLIIISEFGLEHAEEVEFNRLTGYTGDPIFRPGESPLVELYEWLKNIYCSGDVVIADIGLTVRLTKPPLICINNRDYAPSEINCIYDNTSNGIKYEPTS